MKPLIQCVDVSRVYRLGRQNVAVLDRLSLDVAKGDFLALMGPSGSGKTTLLNLLGGLDQPTSGQVLFDGTPLREFSPRALARWRSKNVGFIFQFYNLLPVLNARRNVELPLLVTKLAARDRKRRAMAALKIVGLDDRARHKPRELSGGQQQRVAIARAIVRDPDLLVCDEPTGDLDRATADDVLRLLTLLNQEYEKTIIMVTHDPKAADHARRTLHLDKGRLAQETA